MSNQEPLALCNLMSTGRFPNVAAARKHLAENSDGAKGERTPPPAKPATASGKVAATPGTPTTVEGFQDALKSRNIPFHPRAGLEKLATLYQAEVLDKAKPETTPGSDPENPENTPPGPETPPATGTGIPGHSEPGDGN